MESFDAHPQSSRPDSRSLRTPKSRSQQTTIELKQSFHPTSALLQEKLLQSRRLESERVSARSSTDMLASSAQPRSLRSPSPSDGRRPNSGGGSQPVQQKKGLGVKEMEQILSTLHKQNFDLKLELFHRRERQTALEARLEKLEREKKERDDMNDILIHELEKRDKAVEEAVSMILALEERVERLVREREMVRQVESEGTAYPHIDSPASTPAPRATSREPRPVGEPKTPIRMPSFVSEQSEHTENLRSVYLGARESTASLQRLAEETPDTAHIEPRLGSPALSVLSESSFMSIYGRDRVVGLSTPPGNSPWPWDPDWNCAPRNRISAQESPTKFNNSAPTKPQRRPSSRAANAGHGQFQNIGNVLDAGPSPLQRLERLDVTRAATIPGHNMDQPPFVRPPTAQERRRDVVKSPPFNQHKDQLPIARPSTSQGRTKTKKERREALEKILTRGHFSNSQTLPPTPDTLSTTTLPQNETLSKEQGPEGEPSSVDSQVSAHHDHGGNQEPHLRASQPASTTAFDSRKQHPAADEDTGPSLDPRPAFRRDSTASSVDTWLRESLKPESLDVLDPMSSASQAHASAKAGRISPDLFSFPTSTSGWAANAMFGSLGGTGFFGFPGKETSGIADMLDAIGASVPAPAWNMGRVTPTLVTAPTAPPPPNRRSSLLARTGQTSADETPRSGLNQSTPGPSPVASTQTKGPTRVSRSRSNSTDIRPPTRHLTEPGLKQDRAMTVPPKQVLHLPPPPTKPDTPGKQDTPTQSLPKQRHYPPTASQGSRPRSRGLNSLFRRSSGSSSSTAADAASQLQVPAPPASAPPTQTSFKPPPPPPPPSAPVMGIPSWVRRNSLVDDDDRASVTPPPILRNKVVVAAAAAAAAAAGATPGKGGDDDDGGGGGVALDGSRAAGAAGGGGGGVAVAGPSGSSAKMGRKSWAGSSGSGSGSASGSAEGVEGGGGAPLGGSGAGGGKRKWLGLGRVSSLRNRGV